uniref:Transposase n=1 Tax=Ascaris lumbricoides TaxID=6252 RepID=A0A0M3IXS1_ASCLU
LGVRVTEVFFRRVEILIQSRHWHVTSLDAASFLQRKHLRSQMSSLPF